MKTPIAFLLVVAGLLLGGIVQAQTGGPGRGYAVQAGTATGGNYQLASLSWRVSGMAAGGPYGLTVAADRAAGGNQCCCTYLPLILRNK